MTHNTKGVPRRRLTTGDNSYTCAYIIETVDEEYFVGRGVLEKTAFTGEGIETEIGDIEIIGEVNEEYVGDQLAEKRDGEWEEANLRLDPEYDTEPPEARVLNYDGSGTEKFKDVEEPEARRYLEEFLRQQT